MDWGRKEKGKLIGFGTTCEGSRTSSATGRGGRGGNAFLQWRKRRKILFEVRGERGRNGGCYGGTRWSGVSRPGVAKGRSEAL